MKSRIGIIILNYLCWEATVKCVECFQNQISDYRTSNLGMDICAEIVIVDNDSPNESYLKLLSEYKDNSSIHVHKTKKNIGYARGNNFGYRCLKRIMTPDFVILSNDDAYAMSEGLLKWMFEMYEAHDFAVLGPSILSMRSGLHQSPWPDTLDCFGHLVSRYIRNQNKEYQFLKKDYGELIKHSEFHDDMVVCGAFLIFSPKYMEKYNDLFNPKTFLYAEENLLKIRCDKYRLKMIYDPSYEVNHEESASFYDGKTEEVVLRVKNKYHRDALDIYDHEYWRLKHYGVLRRLFDTWYISREGKKGHKYVFPAIRSYNMVRVVIYGAGKIGTALYEQCSEEKKITVVRWVDRNKRSDIVQDPSYIGQSDFDYVFIAINDARIVREVSRELQKQGIADSKIKWIKAYKVKL